MYDDILGRADDMTDFSILFSWCGKISSLAGCVTVLFSFFGC